VVSASLLVQLAKGAGATVIALASGPHKLAVAEGAGADVVVDYSVVTPGTSSGQPPHVDPGDVQSRGVSLIG